MLQINERNQANQIWPMVSIVPHCRRHLPWDQFLGLASLPTHKMHTAHTVTHTNIWTSSYRIRYINLCIIWARYPGQLTTWKSSPRQQNTWIFQILYAWRRKILSPLTTLLKCHMTWIRTHSPWEHAHGWHMSETDNKDNDIHRKSKYLCICPSLDSFSDKNSVKHTVLTQIWGRLDMADNYGNFETFRVTVSITEH